MYDPRTGKELRTGATVDTTTVDPTLLKYDSNTGTALTNVSTTPQTINSTNLTPVKPVVLPDGVPQTGADGLGGAVQSSVDTQKAANEKQQLKDQQDALAAQKSGIDSTMREIMGANTDIANAPNTIDRTAQDKAQKEADTYTSQIEAEQLANRRQIEALQKNNPQGLFGGGLEQEINRINNISVSKQADLAILQNSALRNWKTASEIADRQLTLKLEPLKANLDNLKYFYEQNKADFNIQDQRLYDAQVKKADAALKQETDLQTQIKDIKMGVAQYGGEDKASILSQLSALDTTDPKALDKALEIGGKYLTDPITRAIQVETLKAAEIKNQADGTNFTITIPNGSNQFASRNNNPGNLKYVGQGGATLGAGGFAKFDTPEAGYQALLEQIKLDQGRGLTLAQFVNKYAPSSENDTKTYVSQIVDALGVPENTSIKNISTMDMADFIIKKESGSTRDVSLTDTQAQAEAIIAGRQAPPNPAVGRSSVATQKLFAELARRGFDVNKGYLDYQASLKTVASLNGPQMVRFRGLATSVVNTIDEVKTLADQMSLSGVPKLNKLELLAYQETQGNSDKGQLVAKYLGAVNTLKEEFANLANGGYAPTEAAWELANSQINSNYGVDQMSAALTEVQRLINFRVTALTNVTPTTLGGSTDPTTEYGNQVLNILNSGSTVYGAYSDILTPN